MFKPLKFDWFLSETMLMKYQGMQWLQTKQITHLKNKDTREQTHYEV